MLQKDLQSVDGTAGLLIKQFRDCFAPQAVLFRRRNAISVRSIGRHRSFSVKDQILGTVQAQLWEEKVLFVAWGIAIGFAERCPSADAVAVYQDQGRLNAGVTAAIDNVRADRFTKNAVLLGSKMYAQEHQRKTE